MPQPSTNLVDAVSGEEVCPLCFDRYSGADACTCVVCRVASCPSCAELLDVDLAGVARELNPDGAVRCFACRPAPSAAAAARGLFAAPLSLPRPVSCSRPDSRAAVATYQVEARGSVREQEQAPAGLPPLPFPLTTSPRGVRVLKPRAPGTVFVGLPPVAPTLSQSLHSATPARPPTGQLERLAGRARQKLLLLARLVTLATMIGARAKPLLARLQQEGARLRARLPGYRALARARLGALRDLVRARLPGYRDLTRARHGKLRASARARLVTLRPLAGVARARLNAAFVAVAARRATLRTRLAPQAEALRTQLAEQLVRLSLLVRGPARFDPPVVKPKVADPSRPIHL
jgi:hypothetical protein